MENHRVGTQSDSDYKSLSGQSIEKTKLNNSTYEYKSAQSELNEENNLSEPLLPKIQ